MQNDLERILRTIAIDQLGQGEKILFYPSCGINVSWLCNLPYDTFILVDHANGYGPQGRQGITTDQDVDAFWILFSRNLPTGIELISSTNRFQVFHFNGRRFYLLIAQNREVLRWMQKLAIKLHCFVGLNDGCCEGGNDECVNDRDFLEAVCNLSSVDGMEYITDHLDGNSTYSWIKTDFAFPKFAGFQFEFVGRYHETRDWEWTAEAMKLRVTRCAK